MKLHRRFLAVATAAATLAAPSLSAPVAGASPAAFTCSFRQATVPVPHNRPLADLYDVKIVSGRDAWAVGVYARLDPIHHPHRTFPLMEHWNGRRWSSVSVPRTPQADVEDLSKMAVVSTTNVWAIGNESRRPRNAYTPGPVPGDLNSVPINQTLSPTSQGVIDRWDGHSWRRVVLPKFAGSTQFSSITAAGPGDVWLVGMWKARHVHPAPVLPLFLHWDGKTWTKQHPNLFPTARMTSLSDIQASSTKVLVVGTAQPGSSFSASLRDGTWAVSPAPALSDLSGDWGISGGQSTITQGTDEFAAFGAYQRGSAGWTNVPTAPLWKVTNESAANVFGTDVLDNGPSSAWLVGSQMDWDWQWGDINGFGPVYAEHWDGTTWGQVRLPTEPSLTAPWLNAVDATSGGGMVMMAGTFVPPHRMKSLPLIYQGSCG